MMDVKGPDVGERDCSVLMSEGHGNCGYYTNREFRARAVPTGGLVEANYLE